MIIFLNNLDPYKAVEAQVGIRMHDLVRIGYREVPTLNMGDSRHNY